ncbi:LLM class flavin-dependent oxidoreductase [Rhodovarius crocodyli]|uniref:LLM class flavin-dependent oxidoreductase n=1 Tax=Rhodovarius crocodyli TaxID=1979269 RepID=A0A437MEA0_9PROT|nr:LLM class flavin-dependent oxidoreductase [Rhodovarius crocodyli]RVT95967.1 LLM class flavin-dependent oxidoreductase [Rhodovarius crocodyli]
MSSPRQMHLGCFILAAGHHIAGWRMPEAEAGSENLDLVVRVAQKAEQGKFDLVFLADAVNTRPDMHPSMVLRLEPLTLLAALSMVTKNIGLAATASTTYTEPYNLARYLGSIDHMSGGRCGWNIVTGAFADAAKNFGREKHPEHDERYAMATEFVACVKALWDSCEDGIWQLDKAAGRFIDAAKMHTPGFEGKYFSSKGPLNMSRMPQGYPVMIQAGASEAGRDVAGRIAEIVYAVHQDMGASKAFCDDLKRRAVSFGRSPDHIKIMPGVSAVIGGTEAEAKRKLEELGECADPKVALQVLAERLGHDLTGYDLDAPVPDLPPSGIMRGHAETLQALAKKDRLTLRQLRNFVAASMGHRLIVGTPEQVADGLQEWFEAGAADGFNIMPPWFPTAFDDFVDQVVPILQKRGLFRQEYTASTLRGHLGLPRPEWGG